MASRPLRQWHHIHSRHPPPTIAHYNGTLQWHHVHSAKVGRHPPNHSTLQCHHVHSPKVGRHPPPTTIAQQWHPAMAPSNGTQAMASRPLNHSTLQWHPAMAPSNGTTSTAPCNGILVPRPMRKSGSSPSPPIGSKNPYSYRYPGNKSCAMWMVDFFLIICIPAFSRTRDMA